MKNNLVLIILIIMLFLPICTLSECYPTFVPDNTTAGLYYWTGCNEVEEDIATEEEAKTIKTLVLPSDMQFYNGWYNYQLKGLEEYKVADSSQFLKCIDGVVFTKDQKILLAYPRNKANTKYIIPTGVVGIAENAFAGNSHLQEVVFSEEVEWIEGKAFSECSSLRMISLNNALSCIDDRAFEYCGELKELRCPAGLRIIGYRAFYMSGLSSIMLNDGLICVMGEAFYTQKFGTAEIILPETVLYFERTVFSPTESIVILCSDNPCHARLQLDGGAVVYK